MAGGLDQQRKAAITIPASSIGGTSGTLAHDLAATLFTPSMPTEIFAEAQNGGGDVRATLDAEGLTPLPLDVVVFDTATPQAEIVVLIPAASVDKAAGVTIYLWWQTAGTDSQPAASDPLGRNAVWANTHAAWRFDSLGTVVDRSGNGIDFTITGGTLVSGPFGSSALIDAADSTDSAATGFLLNQQVDYTVATVCELTDDDGLNRAHVWGLFTSGGGLHVQGENTRFIVAPSLAPASFSYPNNVLSVNHGVLPEVGDSTAWWSNSIDGAGNSDTTADNVDPADLGLFLNDAPGESRKTACRWDWIRVYDFLVDADWHLTEWNMFSDPASFATAGAVEDVGGGGGVVSESLTQGLGLSSAIAGQVAAQASLTQGMGLSETGQGAATAQASLTQGMGLSETEAARAVAQASLSQGIALSESQQARAAAMASLVQGMGLAETEQGAASAMASLAQALGLTISQSSQTFVAQSLLAGLGVGLSVGDNVAAPGAAQESLTQGFALSPQANGIARAGDALVVDLSLTATVTDRLRLSEAMTQAMTVGASLDDRAGVDVSLTAPTVFGASQSAQVSAQEAFAIGMSLGAQLTSLLPSLFTPAENRTFKIEAETRIVSVGVSTRKILAPAESRAVKVRRET